MVGANQHAVLVDAAPGGQAQRLIAAFDSAVMRFEADALADPVIWQAFSQTYQLEEVSHSLIAEFKTEVDRLVRFDKRTAMQVAEYAAALARHSSDLKAQALGERTLGMALHLYGRYSEAVEHYNEARRLYGQAGCPVEKARSERAQVDALIYLGRYEEALTLADTARQVFIQHKESLLLAQLESNTGNIYHRLDRHRDALTHYERAAELMALHAPEQLAQIRLNCANAYCNLDDFRQAQTLYTKADELYSANGDESGAVLARYSLGYLHFLRGAYHQAMRAMHETRGESLRIGDERYAALCILDLSEIYLQLNMLDEAAQFAAQARAQFQTLGIRYEAARAATFLGLAQLRQGKLDEAAQTFDMAHEEFELEGNAVQIGLLQLHQAEVALARGQFSQARELAAAAENCFLDQQLIAKTCAARIVKARAIMGAGFTARSLGESIVAACVEVEAPWLQAQACELLGDACLAEGDAEAAYTQFAAAVSAIEQIRGQIRVDEFRSAFFRDKLRVYEKLIRLCLDEANPAQAFYYLERAKARTLVDLLVNDLELTPGKIETADATSADLLAQWQQLREELHWHYSKLSQAESLGQSRLLTADQHLRSEIARCERGLAETTSALQAADPNFVLLESTGGMQAAELCKLLTENEVVIEYYCEGEHLWIFLIERDGLQVVFSPIDLTDIREHLQTLRFQFDKFHYEPSYLTSHAERLQKGTEICLHELWQALIAPIAPRIKGKRLIFIPFGVLHNVPFQALFDGEHYLIEDHEITQAPSARLLQLCTGRAFQVGEQATIFGVADQNTPHITAEIEAIRALFPSAQCFVGAEATAAAFTAAASGSNILHLASHALFRQDNPLFSAFKLSDTWLNLYDIGALKLPASLVTLSGCNTGASRVYAGDELMGLARGFLAAGAAALVVSLWAVNDEATAHLMTAFYQNLRAGLPPRTALREATLAAKSRFSHPYFWSPFILLSHT